MNCYNPAQTCYRSNIGYRYRARRQRGLSWLMDTTLLLNVGKIALTLGGLALLVNLLMASSFNKIQESVLTVENTRHELMDTQIKLRVQRAQLYSREQVQLLAAEKFSLHVPQKEQVKVF